MLMKTIWLSLLSAAAAAKYTICTDLPEGITIQLAEELRGPATIDLSEIIVEGKVEVAIFRNSKLENGLKITDEISTEGYCSQDIRRTIQEEGHGEVFTFHKAPPQMIHNNLDTGPYVVLFAYCGISDFAQVCGRVSFQSKHGYLPAWITGTVWCTYFTTAFYLGVVVFIVRRYHLPHNGKRLITDKVILAVLLLGSAEMVLISAHYFMYNRSGIEQDSVRVLADLLGCLKIGTGHALLLLTAFGGGLVRDFIVPINSITCLCTVYTLLLGARVTMHYLVQHHDFSLFFDILCGILDAYFILWSTLAVTGVIRNLEASDAARAKRFVHLRRWIILFALATMIPLKRLLVIEGDSPKAEYVLPAVKRAGFLCLVLFLQWFLATIPAQRRSRVRVELPNIMPAFTGKRRQIRAKRNGNFPASDVDSYSVEDDEEAPITNDDESSIRS